MRQPSEPPSRAAGGDAAAAAPAHAAPSPVAGADAGGGGIRLLHVSKSFGRNEVVRDVSLTIGSAEFIVFLGPSGCGKSTLLRTIAGLEAVDAGEIWIGDRRVDPLPPGERGVAMVFQHYALYPHMSIRENLAFGLRNVGVPRAEIERRVAEAAALLEISDLMARKPGQISGGQRQRVAIGRAIVKEPRLFLFDEPLSNLDAALRVRTRLEIAQLHRRVGAAMVFVTHDQVEAMTLADRIVVMSGHGIEQVGEPMEIYSRPATRFVAGFVGTPSMNFLDVEVENGANGFARARLPDGSRLSTRIEIAALPSPRGLELGIRAESVRICAPDDGGSRGRARFVERLGDRTLVYAELADGSTVVAEDAGSSRVAAGDAVGLSFDPGAVHLFAAGSAWHAQTEDRR